MSEPQVRLYFSNHKEVEIEDRSFDTSSSGGDDIQTSEETDISAGSENFNGIEVPIVGYEIMEERAKFTIFKLKVENKSSDDCWFVFRRYTDFVCLHSKLKVDYPTIRLHLPRKKWFGDNFSPYFLRERLEGLQDYVNTLLRHQELSSSPYVRDFLCLDERPGYNDSTEETKAAVEALEEKIVQLKRKLREKEIEHEKLQKSHSMEIEAKLRLVSFIQESTKECSSCTLRLSHIGVDNS